MSGKISPGPPGLGQSSLVRGHSGHHGCAPPLGKCRLGTGPGLDPPRVTETGASVSPEKGMEPVRAEITRAATVRRRHDDRVGKYAFDARRSA